MRLRQPYLYSNYGSGSPNGRSLHVRSVYAACPLERAA